MGFYFSLLRYESEFFQQQLCLEGEKSSAVSQSRALQDEVARLQDRLATLLVTGGDRDTHPGLDQAAKSLAHLRSELVGCAGTLLATQVRTTL